ncbi:MAG: DUF4249 family protein [Saprospiraceae bacterium]
MYIKQLTSILVSLSFLFVACEKPVDLDVGYEEKLVVISHFRKDLPFYVTVSKSLDPLSTERDFPEYLENATVSIYNGEVLLCELPYSESIGDVFPFDGYGQEDCVPEEGVEYTLRVSAPSLKGVFASGIIPSETEITAFHLSNLVKTFLSDTTAKFEFNLQLRLAETSEEITYYLLDFNYERIPFQVVGNDTLKVRTGIFDPVILETFDESTPMLTHFDEKVQKVLFVKKGKGPLELDFSGRTSNSIFLTIDLFDQIYANLRTVSEDYYKYHSQLSKQKLQKDSLFVNPVVLADNVENGFGIFAGYQLTIDSVAVMPE